MGCAAITCQRKNHQNSDDKIVAFDQIRITPAQFIQKNAKRFPEEYYTEDILGQGHSSHVQICIHRKTGEKRAVKIINKELSSDEELRNKFVNEINMLRGLRHPNIVHIYEFFEDAKRFFIVMELCEGAELFYQVISRRNFTPNSVLQIMQQLVSAIGYLHENNVMHRNLTQEHILLNFEASDFTSIKVIGFSKATTFQRNRIQFNQQGTLLYMAPEVIEGHYNEKCDIWSCGIIFHVLLIGYPPFEGQDEEDTINQIQSLKLKFEDQAWDNIPNEARNLLEIMLSPLTQRPTAEQVLKHPFFALRQTGIENSNYFSQILQNMKNFSGRQKFRDAIRTMIITVCQQANEIEQLGRVFLSIDENGDGKLSRQELFNAYCRIYDQENAQKHVDKIMSEVDTDDNGFIDYVEFIKSSLSNEQIFSQQNLQIIFNRIDKENKGNISAQQFKTALQGSNKTDDAIWDQLVENLDKDGNGLIDFEEFCEIVNSNIQKLEQVQKAAQAPTH